MQIRQESKSLIMLELMFDSEGWTCSVWNEVQSSVNQSIEFAGSVNQEKYIYIATANDASRPRYCIQATFDKARLDFSVSIESGSIWSSEANKGVTYSSLYDDIMAGVSF